MYGREKLEWESKPMPARLVTIFELMEQEAYFLLPWDVEGKVFFAVASDNTYTSMLGDEVQLEPAYFKGRIPCAVACELSIEDAIETAVMEWHGMKVRAAEQRAETVGTKILPFVQRAEM